MADRSAREHGVLPGAGCKQSEISISASLWGAEDDDWKGMN